MDQPGPPPVGLVGVVALLRRFPLRSAAGEHPGAAALTPTGLEHDRRWQLLDAGGEPVTARRAPGLAGLAARVEGTGGGARLVVTGSGAGPGGWAEALAGPGARVADAAHRAHREGAAVHLVSAGAADDPAAPRGCDPGLRANVVLALDPRVAAPGDERAWTGRRLRLGPADGDGDGDGGGGGGGDGAVLVLTRVPRRCLGVYAEVLAPGRVRVGDPVVLLADGSAAAP